MIKDYTTIGLLKRKLCTSMCVKVHFFCMNWKMNVVIFFFFQSFQNKIPRNELPGRPLELFMCSVLKRQGYGEGFRWIANYID